MCLIGYIVASMFYEDLEDDEEEEEIEYEASHSGYLFLNKNTADRFTDEDDLFYQDTSV